jgi:hypothetical protein
MVYVKAIQTPRNISGAAPRFPNPARSCRTLNPAVLAGINSDIVTSMFQEETRCGDIQGPWQSCWEHLQASLKRL